MGGFLPTIPDLPELHVGRRDAVWPQQVANVAARAQPAADEATVGTTSPDVRIARMPALIGAKKFPACRLREFCRKNLK